MSHPLEAYADSYAQMSRDGDGRVDCRSVEIDIRQNMIPVTRSLDTPANAHGVSELTDRFIASVLPPLSEREITIACLAIGYVTAALSVAEAKVVVKPVTPRRTFPILSSGGQKIDWQLVADHGKQAQANHYQSVERLAERGGLSWSELHAVLHNKKWQKVDENEAIITCRALEASYLSALASPGQQDSGWRSMASAPKDGIEILVWTGRRRHVAYFDHVENDWVASYRTTTKRLLVAPSPLYWYELPASPSKEGA